MEVSTELNICLDGTFLSNRGDVGVLREVELNDFTENE